MQNYATEAEQLRLQRFIESLEQRCRKPKTIQSYMSAHAALFGTISQNSDRLADITELTPPDLRLWRANAIGSMKPATINHRLLFLRHYSQWNMEQGDLEFKQHAGFVAAARDVPSTKLGAKSLSVQELQRFLGVVETQGNLRDKAIIFLLLSGLRVSEVIGLQPCDIVLNLHRGHVIIHGHHVKFSAARDVPLNRQVRFYLQAYLNSLGDKREFMTGQRGRLSTNGIYKIVITYAEQANIELHPHQLRHQFAKLWLEANQNDLSGLKAVLGHSSIETTSRYYARKSLDDLQVGVDNIKM